MPDIPREAATSVNPLTESRRLRRSITCVVRDRVLSRSALAVAGLVWDSLNAKVGYAWPGVNYIASELRINRASVFRGLNELYARGWLLKEQGRRGRSNRYRIAFGSFDLDGTDGA